MPRALGITLEHLPMKGVGGGDNPVMSSIPDTVAWLGSVAVSHLPPLGELVIAQRSAIPLQTRRILQLSNKFERNRREDGLSVLVVAS